MNLHVLMVRILSVCPVRLCATVPMIARTVAMKIHPNVTALPIRLVWSCCPVPNHAKKIHSDVRHCQPKRQFQSNEIALFLQNACNWNRSKLFTQNLFVCFQNYGTHIKRIIQFSLNCSRTIVQMPNWWWMCG